MVPIAVQYDGRREGHILIISFVRENSITMEDERHEILKSNRYDTVIDAGSC